MLKILAQEHICGKHVNEIMYFSTSALSHVRPQANKYQNGKLPMLMLQRFLNKHIINIQNMLLFWESEMPVNDSDTIIPHLNSVRKVISLSKFLEQLFFLPVAKQNFQTGT